MKVCTYVILGFCSMLLVSGNHHYRVGHWEFAAVEESSEICTWPGYCLTVPLSDGCPWGHVSLGISAGVDSICDPFDPLHSEP